MLKNNAIKILFFLLLVITCSGVKAQELIIPLSRHKLTLKPEGFIVDSVVDVRYEKQIVGFFQKGLLNISKPARFEHTAKKEFEALFNKVGIRKPTDGHLTIRINKLAIREETSPTRETSIAEMNISFLIKKEGAYYELYRAAAFSEKSGIDVSNFHAANIIKALDKCLDLFNNESNKNANINTLTDINKNPLHKAAVNILKSKTIQRGIYKTFNEFRDNLPDTSNDFIVEYLKDSTVVNSKASAKWTSNLELIKDVWGFSDGESAFINIRNKYYKLQKERDNFILHINPPSSSAGGLYGGIAGGAVGALIGISIELATVKKIPYKLNFTTGSFIPLYEDDEMKFDGKIIFYLSNYVKQDQNVDLYANGQELCTLYKNTYYEFLCKPDQQNVEFTVQSGDLKSSITLVPQLFTTDFYLCRFKKGQPIIDHPVSNISSEILKNIESGKITKID